MNERAYERTTVTRGGTTRGDASVALVRAYDVLRTGHSRVSCVFARARNEPPRTASARSTMGDPRPRHRRVDSPSAGESSAAEPRVARRAPSKFTSNNARERGIATDRTRDESRPLACLQTRSLFVAPLIARHSALDARPLTNSNSFAPRTQLSQYAQYGGRESHYRVIGEMRRICRNGSEPVVHVVP